MSSEFLYWEKIRDLIKVVWKRSLNSQTGHISHATNFPESTHTDSLSECVLGPMISHATSQETHRQTHLLDVFSGSMISHATSQETQRQTHTLDVFSSPMINHATSQETQRQTHSLNVLLGPMISYATSQETLTTWMCFQVPCVTNVLLLHF